LRFHSQRDNKKGKTKGGYDFHMINLRMTLEIMQRPPEKMLQLNITIQTTP
jgi:hypothetical protein